MTRLVPATVLAVAQSSTSHAQQSIAKDTLLGSGKVRSLKATVGDNTTLPLGEKVGGYVTITPSRIWLLFVDSTRGCARVTANQGLNGSGP